MAANIVQYILNIKTSSADKNLKGLIKAVNKTGAEFSGLDSETKQSSSEIAKLSIQSSKASSKIKQLSRNLSNASNQSKKITASTFVAAESFLSLASRAVVAVKAFADFAQRQADLVNNLNDLSTRSGLAANSIQALQFAFVASGQSAEQVQGLVDKMPKMMANLARGTGSATVAFDRLGVSIFDVDGKMKTSQAVFVELSTALQNIESGTERATIAAELFGRQAGNMLQAFGQTEGLANFISFTDKWGIDTGPAASEQAAQFQQAIAALTLAVNRFGQIFGTVFGENGFVGPIKLAGQAFIFFGSLIDKTIENSKSAFQGFLLDVEKRTLQIQLIVAQLQEAFAIFSLDTEGIKSGAAEVARLETELKIVNDLVQDRAVSGLVDALEGESSAFQKASKDAAEFGKELDSLMDKLGAASTATGTVISAPKLEEPTGAAEVVNKWEAVRVDQLTKEMEALDNWVETSGNEFATVFQQIEVDFQSAMRQGIALGIQESVATGITAIAGGPGSMVSGLGEMAGPRGEMAAGIVNALATLGEKSPAQIQAEMEGFSNAIVKGILMLPEILIKVLPPMLVKLAFKIVDALLKLPALIGKQFFSAIGNLIQAIKDWLSLNSDERKEKRQSRREKVGNWFKETFSFQGGGRYVPSAQGGLRYTDKSWGGAGLAMLQPGETVVPQSGQMSDATRQNLFSQMGGGGLSVNINADIVEGNAVDALVRKLEQRFLEFGGGRSPLFNVS